MLDIQPRLQQWYATIPELSKAHPASIFASQAYWDAIYNNTILLLHRPKSTVLHVSNEASSISFDASCKLIANIKILQRDGKIDIMWKYVHHLFMAGLGVIYSIWQFKEIRDRTPVRSSISMLQSCATTLAAMSETFPGASSCRNVFDSLSSATIDWLLTNDADEVRQNRLDFEKQVQDLLQQLQPSREGCFETNECGTDNMSNMLSADNFAFNDADEVRQNRLDFEKQVQDLLQQLQPSREGCFETNECGTDNMSNMLSADNFAFGEMLNSAAQWPFLDYMGFGDFDGVGPDPIQVAGFVSGADNLEMT